MDVEKEITRLANEYSYLRYDLMKLEEEIIINEQKELRHQLYEANKRRAKVNRNIQKIKRGDTVEDVIEPAHISEALAQLPVIQKILNMQREGCETHEDSNESSART